VNEVARLERIRQSQLVALGLSHELDEGRRLRLPAEAADAAVRHQVGAPAHAIGLGDGLGQDRAVEDVVDERRAPERHGAAHGRRVRALRDAGREAAVVVAAELGHRMLSGDRPAVAEEGIEDAVSDARHPGHEGLRLPLPGRPRRGTRCTTGR
jgi:hypothetical protein